MVLEKKLLNREILEILCKYIIILSTQPPIKNFHHNKIKFKKKRYIIEEGHFEVSKAGEGKLTECGVGQMFGELALLYGAQRSATVTCVQPAKMWSLDRNTFK